MANAKNIFKRQFTYIKNIQDAEKVYYNLYETNSGSNTTYGIEIISEKNHALEETSLKQISESKNFIVNILTYLYENAVKPEHALGIINDLINEDFLRLISEKTE